MKILCAGVVLVLAFAFTGPVSAQTVSIDPFPPDILTTSLSTDPGQFSGHSLTGVNLDTDPPGLWRVLDGRLDPPQGTFLDGRYCPMFEQILDRRMLRDVRIRTTFFTGEGFTTHPGILFRGTDANNFGWVYIRPHVNGSTIAVVLSSAANGFWSQSGGNNGPHFEGLAGVVSDVGFNRTVELVVEIVNNKLSVDINGVRRISDFDLAAAGYAAEGMSGVATCDNEDPSMNFLSFSVTPLNENRPPVANAGPDQTIIVGESASFTGTGSSDPDGSIANFQWDFGDGGTANGAIVGHLYTSAGTFTATLAVTDNNGATATDTAVVTVQTASQAIQSVSNLVASFNFAQGISNSLDAKLQNVLDALNAANAGDRQDTSNKLMAFINAVNAQRGKEITSAEADALVALAMRILAAL